MLDKTILTSSNTGKKYKKIRSLGKGQYGNVYLIQDEQNNHFALKLVDLNIIRQDKNMLSLFENEIRIMEMMNNPRILKLYDKLQIKHLTGLVTMFCDSGNLEELIINKNKNGLGEKQATIFLKQIAEGFKAMQANKIIHRDLKLANIFLHQGNIVIGDFGFAKIGVSITKTKLGTPYYMAPEILNSQNKKFYSNKIDLWSIGICYYFLIFGFMPFQDATDKPNLYNKEKKYSGNRLRFFDKKCSPQVKFLLQRLIEFNPDKRMSFKELFESPLIKINSINNNNFINPNINNNIQQIPQNNLINNFNQSHMNSEFSFKSDISLNNYLYYKNIIIFIVDSAKKIKITEKENVLRPVMDFIFKIQLILIKKSMNVNYYIKNIMEQKINKFNLANFDKILKSNDYYSFYKFFNDFSGFVNKLYIDTKKTLMNKNSNINLNEIDNFDNNNCDKFLLKALYNILGFFKKNSFSFNSSSSINLLQGVIYVFFNIDLFTKFPINSKFLQTKEWQDFCTYLNSKSPQDIQSRMFDFFKIT